MKILYLTPWPPSQKNGGERHCLANLISLTEIPNAEIDYIGPCIPEESSGLTNKINLNIFSKKFNSLDKIQAYFSYSATSLIGTARKFGNIIKSKKYDLLFIESTKCSFIFNLGINYKKSICSVHNIEVDYYRHNSIKLSRPYLKRLISSEKTALQKSDLLLFLHTRERDRFQELYGPQLPGATYKYHPVCSFQPESSLVPFEDRENVIFFSGSLDCEYNESSITEFVNNCWHDLQDTGLLLRVAGRNPSEKLRRFLSEWRNIELIPNPSNMEVMLRNAKALILPDTSGTGMKLRVAEAISLGVPVVGTKKGLYGYESIESFGQSVESITDMSAVLINLLIQNPKHLNSLSQTALDAWKDKYSFDSFKLRLQDIIFSLYQE